MPDREWDLERELRELGLRVEYPPTPDDLAGSVRRRIEREDEAQTNRRDLFWLPALSPRWAVAAMLLIVLSVPVLSPAARDEISGLFVPGVGASYESDGAAQSAAEGKNASGDKMAAGQSVSQAAAAGGANAAPESDSYGQTAAPSSGSAGAAVGCGAEKITLHRARIRAGADRPVLLPERYEYDQPDEVYDASTCYGAPALGLVYRDRPGLPAIGNTEIGMVLTEIPGNLEATYRKNTPEYTGREDAMVGGKRAYWLPNARLDPLTSGQVTTGKRGRPKVNVLLWEQVGLSLRLESNLGKEEAVRIAESVR